MRNKKVRILIADNNPVFYHQFKSFLEDKGFEVLPSVSKGQEVLAYIDQKKVDIILMELLLTGVDESPSWNRSATFRIRRKFLFILLSQMMSLLILRTDVVSAILCRNPLTLISFIVVFSVFQISAVTCRNHLNHLSR